MIPIQLKLILLFFCVMILVILIKKIKKYQLELKYALLWIFINLAGIFLSIFPHFLFYISDWLYIETPVNALFLLSLVALFFVLYSLTVASSRSSNKIKNLSQEIGLLKIEIEEMKKNRIVGSNEN
ncbi:DUF2304 domain-containing protein [Paenibacillus sp. FSL M8-0228]|uniref:DUF2304 domain-containing protein n=1 Tax=Paenibacillus TaxID=44249 RepID=UPI00083D3348|nr:DUF2304 domain-containing protein [Paenibacillus polymyxa]MBO3285367.1 DUF2304 domain-containing protein [Paenibacillus polymyxa]MDQ0049014.1 hypothetical protein [Paenibacillus polymyxa]ODB57158.1 hypothetical protein A7311_15585 [Paenibacillus polymyxa]